MTSKEILSLGRELDEITLEKPIVALAELKSVLSAVIDHIYFRQAEHERAIGRRV